MHGTGSGPGGIRSVSNGICQAGCNPYAGSGGWTGYLNPACFVPPSVGSVGLESGINYLNAPGGLNFDMGLRFRIDACNVFNHTIFTGVNSGLSFTPYTANSSGGINNSVVPAHTSTALAIKQPGTGL